MKNGEKLILEEYIRVLCSNEPKRAPEETRPLTLREYISIRPVPAIDDLSVLAKGVSRLFRSVFRK